MEAIDHIVIVAKEPAQAAYQFGQKHGITTVEGGQHTHWGTYNHLAYFNNDCYIEWLGIFDKSLATQSDNPLIKQLVTAFEANVEGPIQLAIRTKQMDAYVKHFLSNDITYTGPIPGSRQKTDGSVLAWRMLFPEISAGVAPFLIEWGSVKNVPGDNHLINKQHLNAVNRSQNIKTGLSVEGHK